MKISTKGRYALRMLIYLAENQAEGYISLKEIAESQNISKKYLEQIIPLFSRADVLRANRGPQGGYMLAKPPKDYTVGEILRMTEGDLAPVSCVGNPPTDCDRSADCATMPVWQGLARVINEYLDGITLQDIVDNHLNSADNYMI